MSRSQADVELVLRARDLASSVVDNFGNAVGGVARSAERAGSRIGAAFRSVSSGITNGLGNLTETLASGGGLGPAMFTFGAYMAGQAAESLIEHLLEKLGESTLVAALGGVLGTAGSALGSLLSSAIALGAAAFPAVLLALIVGAIVFLINNPAIANQILDFAGGLVDGIMSGLGQLPGLLLSFFGTAWQAVVDHVLPFIASLVGLWLSIPGKLAQLGYNIVQTIVTGLASLPGKVADVVRDAFARLDIRVGPFHITGKGITVELPNITVPSGQGGSVVSQATKGHARGGWVGLAGPELGVFGEHGPELVIPADKTRQIIAGGSPGGGSGAPAPAGVVIEGVTADQIVDMVDRGLFFRLRRAPAQAGRV